MTNDQEQTLDDARFNRPESGFFADYHQVRAGVAELREVDGLQPDQPERWAAMSTDERMFALQEAENRLARVQGRPAERVHGVPMGDGNYGGYQPSGPQRGIYVNTNPQAFDNRAETVNTVVHEGRHAYQQHAIANPGFHPERAGLQAHEDVQRWKRNDASYQTIDKHGETPYATQAIEHDAGAYGFAVTRGLYPEYRPSLARVDQYNHGNAVHKYGFLRTDADSQKITSSDPARLDQRPFHHI